MATIPNRHKLVSNLMRAVVAHCKTKATRIRGHTIIEDGLGAPMGMTFAAYENGNYMTWFIDDGKYSLYALVNEKMKHIFTVDATTENMKALQAKLDALKEDLEP